MRLIPSISKILTLNTWQTDQVFYSRYLMRMPYIIELITEQNADIVLLQEVGPHFLKALQKSPDIMAKYRFSVCDNELFEKNNCKVIKGGIRRNIWFMMAMPFRILSYILSRKKLQGNIFWDLLGFAEFVWVRKN